MRVTHSFVIPALALALLTGGSTAAALTQGVVQTTPPAACQEDQACWDCETHGNEICGLPDTPANAAARATAWEAWDAHQGWHILRVDPSKEIRVDVIGYSLRPSKDHTSLQGTDGRWYIFDAR